MNLYSQAKKRADSFKGSIFYRLGRDAYLDWSLIVASSVLLAFIFIVIGVYVFLNIGNRMDSKKLSVTPAPAVAIDSRILDAVIDKFEFRAKETKEWQKGYLGIADPSI